MLSEVREVKFELVLRIHQGKGMEIVEEILTRWIIMLKGINM